MNKHTPGPWVVRDTDSAGTPVGYREVESTPRGPRNLTSHIATLYAVTGDPEQEANVLLVAAAPDLFEALEDCLSWLEWLYHPGSDDHHKSQLKRLERARLAMAKAKGGGE